MIQHLKTCLLNIKRKFRSKRVDVELDPFIYD